jgi:3-oxoacyl-[acyl-carrier protein] reductase
MAARKKPAARELENKIAWVIGARGSLGSAIARELALAGAHVVLSSRAAGELKRTGQDIEREAQTRVSVASVDLASRASVDRVAKAIVREHGSIDVLVNCTAAPIFGDFLELTDDDWDTVLQTKLYGYMRSMRAVTCSDVASSSAGPPQARRRSLCTTPWGAPCLRA